MSLKPGGLGSPAAQETPQAFRSSMAEEIEKAFNSLLQREGRPTFSDDNTAESRDRRLLFAAIAQGVCEHLQTQQGSFTVKGVAGATIEIAVDRSES